MIWLLGQMARLPVQAFVYTMEMMVKTLQGLQKMADRSVDALMGRDAPSLPDAPAVESNLSNGPTVGATAHAAGSTPNSESDHPNDTVNLTPDAITSGGEKIEKEQRNMPDTNLSDDMLKLVRYKILFVKRDYEVAFKEEEELVSDNMTETAYAAWKVAEFIQKLKDGETRVPDKWLKVTREEGTTPKFEFESDGDKLKPILKGLKEDDKKYLRVFFEVLQRYPREKFKYEERQIEVLEEIRNKIK